MNKQKHLIVIGGPTASGKTNFSVEVAKHFNSEILSCDSRQFFKEMNIGTAKPTIEERQGIPHHFIDSHSIFDMYNVGDFEKDALALLNHIYKNHNIIVAVGGSGLYIKALCEGLDQFPDVPEHIRQKVRQLYAEQGLEGLQKALQKLDPDYYEIVDQQNPHRLIRALEVCIASGKPFSAFRKAQLQPRNFIPIYIQLDLPREALYERINQRVDDMMEKGLLNEAKSLYPHRNLITLQTVGYQELFDYLDEKISLEEAIEKIKQNSRNYAKRQLTWWRRDGFWKIFHPQQLNETIQFIKNHIIIS
ncbi:MAG: tRNA (adenosine(37)-N6)-dimethylallyltransferase MiaA [Saprospiraceae bacterium]|nr:tRNA (adenosine(37)-N6)-dimethylallyltransferase MiaA [Saprospiraceae bacterium]